jgi:hypothetical protein
MERKTIEVCIPDVNELWESLPEDQKNKDGKINRELYSSFYEYFQREMHNLMSYALRGKKPSIGMTLFHKQGSQYIADFSVNDLEIEIKSSHNFHLQNTSQWLYAGCILVQDGEVSTHH